MKRYTGKNLLVHRDFFAAAGEQAVAATCQRATCGAVIVKDGKIIGRGNNHPPQHDESQRKCNATWNYAKKPKYDLTCCVHAEWAAVIGACKKNGDAVEGSTLYFMRTDYSGNFTDAGKPYCTACSRFAMEAGVVNFALWNQDGAEIYPISEYNRLSYSYHS